MKKLSMIVACILSGSVTTYAQSDITPPSINPGYAKSFFRKQQIKFDCATEGARIFYTTDGSTPTTASTEYSDEAPLYISSTTTINAIAVNGENISAVSTLTCEKTQRIIYIVGEYDGQKYYMGKEPISKGGPLQTIPYNNQSILTPKNLKTTAWLLDSEGRIVDKNTVPDQYLSYSDNNITKLDKQATTWKIVDNEIINTESERALYINPKGYFAAYTSSTNSKAYPVDITKGTTRTGLTVGNFGTVCLPYDVVASDTEGATFYSILGKKEDNGKTTLYLEEETSILKAGIPHIYKVNNENINIYYLDEIKVADGNGNYSSNNGLIGISGNATVPKGMYIIKGTKVVRCGENCKINNGYAYINMDEVPTISETGIKKSIALSTDGATNITEAIGEGENTPQHYYNLQGQRVVTPDKGLYIRNGKKIIIK